MRRVAREELRTIIYVALTVLKPWQKRAIGIDLERTRNAVADDLTGRIMGREDNESVVLVPSPVMKREGQRQGRWGEDEPHPDAYLPPEPVIGPPPERVD